VQSPYQIAAVPQMNCNAKAFRELFFKQAHKLRASLS